MNNAFPNPTIQKLLEEYKPIWSLHYLYGIAYWDLETYMPKNASTSQGEAMAKAASMIQEKTLDSKFTDLVEKAEDESGLNDAEKAVVRRLRRSIDEYKRLPKEFIEEFSREASKSQVVWSKAKTQNDFKLFQPQLEKMVDLNIQKAEYIGYKDHPYDVLIDTYEEGLTTKDVDIYFDSIREFLVDLLDKITSADGYSNAHPLESEKYVKEEVEKLNYKILDYLDYDSNSLRLDESMHPFTAEFEDCSHSRITTWYGENDIRASITATIHEYGHALYDLQCNPSLNYTPIVGGHSLGIHESQSRFWENMIGRSKTFVEMFYNDLSSLSGNFGKYSVDEYFKYFNLVRPSLIRVEADEVTYHSHIMIRFELEKDLITRKLKVSDLPEAWNAKYKEYLGIDVPNDTKGVLQDIHWSGGSFGYFPTYSTGTVLSAVWAEMIEKELGSIDNLIKNKEGIRKIKNWLKENIHQYGTTYTFKDLIQKQTEGEFTTEPWKRYLEGKYL